MERGDLARLNYAVMHDAHRTMVTHDAAVCGVLSDPSLDTVLDKFINETYPKCQNRHHRDVICVSRITYYIYYSLMLCELYQ